MNKIKAQADKLWQLLSQPATRAVYQQAFAVTWAIVKEAGWFLWLVLCLVLVVGDWGWNASYGLGQKARAWLTELQTKPKVSAAIAPQEPVSPAEFWQKTGQSLLSAGQKSVASVLNTAKNQLDLELPVVAIAAPVAKPVPTTPDSVVPAPRVEPRPDVAIAAPDAAIAPPESPTVTSDDATTDDADPENG